MGSVNVFCEVRTGYSDEPSPPWLRRSVAVWATEVRVRSQVSLCEVFGGESDTESSRSPSTSVLPWQPHCTRLHLHVAARRTNGRSLGTFRTAALLRKSESFAWNRTIENVLAAGGRVQKISWEPALHVLTASCHRGVQALVCFVRYQCLSAHPGCSCWRQRNVGDAVVDWSRNNPHFTDPDGSLPYWQQSVGWFQSTPHALFLWSTF